MSKPIDNFHQKKIDFSALSFLSNTMDRRVDVQ